MYIASVEKYGMLHSGHFSYIILVPLSLVESL